MSTSITDRDTEAVGRRSRLQQMLGSAGLDAVVIGPSADLRYFAADAVDTTVAEAFQVADRPALLVVHKDRVRVVAPLLEAGDYPAMPQGCELVTWADGQDLITVALDFLPAGSVIGIADNLPYWLVYRIQSLRDLTGTTAGPLLHTLRAVKTPAELEFMRAASRAADDAYRSLQAMSLVGRSETQVADLICDLLQQHGCDTGSGEALVAAGPNAAVPHHVAGSRVLEAGDVVIIDYGGRVHGYNSDTSRTFVLGAADQKLRDIHATVLQANQAAFAAVRPGVRIQEIDAVARNVIAKAGYAEHFLHRTGHGIGFEVHEHPYVVPGDITVLQEGMTFTIEPGIYVPGIGGVRIEDVIEVTANGANSLNSTSRDLLRLA
ncbi:MAG: M24 family metallopeptidase [Galactobacter sp.]